MSSPHRASVPVDTLRWAHQEPRLCDCPECWTHQPAWRYAELLANRWARDGAVGGRAGLSLFLYQCLARAPWRWRLTRAASWRAARALRAAALADGLHPGELFEAVLRGVARNWPGAAGLPVQ